MFRSLEALGIVIPSASSDLNMWSVHHTIPNVSSDLNMWSEHHTIPSVSSDLNMWSVHHVQTTCLDH
jgi:hypothetical protein